MRVTKLRVSYFDGTPIQTAENWEQLDMTNAANIAMIEETTIMSLSEVQSRYKFVRAPEPKGLKIEESDNIPCDDDFSWKKWNDSKLLIDKPKGSMGS